MNRPSIGRGGKEVHTTGRYGECTYQGHASGPLHGRKEKSAWRNPNSVGTLAFIVHLLSELMAVGQPALGFWSTPPGLQARSSPACYMLLCSGTEIQQLTVKVRKKLQQIMLGMSLKGSEEVPVEHSGRRGSVVPVKFRLTHKGEHQGQDESPHAKSDWTLQGKCAPFIEELLTSPGNSVELSVSYRPLQPGWW